MKKGIAFFIILGLCVIFCLKLFVHIDVHGKFCITPIIDNWGANDWDEHLFVLESAITSIKQYHQLPLWNPWEGGGMVSYQQHANPLLTPFTILCFLFTTPQAVKISIFLHYVIALTGMYIIGRKMFKLNNLFLILIPSSIFVFNGSFFLHFSEGHTWLLPFAYIPFVYYFFEKYVDSKDKKNLILCSLFIALMIFEGGIYPVPMIVLYLIIYSLSMFLLGINKDYILALIEVGVFSILLSSIKVIPLLDYMLVYPRSNPTGSEVIPFHALYKIFLWRGQSLWTFRNGFEGQKFLWHEYGCYIGMGLLGFFIVANILNIRTIKKNANKIPLYICFVLLFLLFLGDFHRFAPFTLLGKLPIFSSTHGTGRFLIMLTFIASLLSFPLSKWVETVMNKSSFKNFWTVIIIICSCAILFDLFRVNTVSFTQALRFNPQEISYYSDKFSHKYEYQFINAFPGYGAYSAMYPGLRMNIATICLYKNNPPQKGIDTDKALVLSTDNSTKISNLKFTPNKISFDAESPGESTIFLNQNYVRGWKFSMSEFSVKNIEHKPAVELPKGTYKNVYFYYFPDSIIIGLVLTVVGILVSWFVIKFRYKLLV